VGGLIFIPTFYSLFVFRLCQGIAMGLYSSMVPIIIKELAPVEISGPLGSYTALSIAFGMFLAPIFAYVLSFITNDETGRYYWYYLFALP
jgi:MFS family permease